MKPPFPPLTFAGKSFTVTHQADTEDGLVPTGFTGSDDEGPCFPVAVLLYHFNRCYVVDIVRITYVNHTYRLINKGLDHPDSEPWFLIKGVKNRRNENAGTVSVCYFIVNGDYEFYPLRSTGESRVEDMAFLPLDMWQRGFDWTTFSAVDKAGVETAIQSYLAMTGLR